MVELPVETLQQAKVVVDDRRVCMAEAGDLIQPIEKEIFSDDHIHGDLGEVITAKVRARESEEEITLFKSVGIAVQDLVTADLSLKITEQSGIGREIIL